MPLLFAVAMLREIFRPSRQSAEVDPRHCRMLDQSESFSQFVFSSVNHCRRETVVEKDKALATALGSLVPVWKQERWQINLIRLRYENLINQIISSAVAFGPTITNNSWHSGFTCRQATVISSILSWDPGSVDILDHTRLALSRPCKGSTDNRGLCVAPFQRCDSLTRFYLPPQHPRCTMP